LVAPVGFILTSVNHKFSADNTHTAFVAVINYFRNTNIDIATAITANSAAICTIDTPVMRLPYRGISRVIDIDRQAWRSIDRYSTKGAVLRIVKSILAKPEAAANRNVGWTNQSATSGIVLHEYLCHTFVVIAMRISNPHHHGDTLADIIAAKLHIWPKLGISHYPFRAITFKHPPHLIAYNLAVVITSIIDIGGKNLGRTVVAK